MSGYVPSSSSLTFTPLPPPVAPTAPDFAFCNPFYGTNLLLEQCTQAAGKLPAGSLSVTYGVRGYRANTGVYNLPTQVSIGDTHNVCSVYVEVVDPRDASFLQAMNIPPDTFRVMASWVINQCVSPAGQGGYATIGIQSMIDWIASQTTTDKQIQDFSLPNGKPRPGFITVTVTGTASPHNTGGGFYDPVTAEALSDGVSQKGNSARAEKLSQQANAMDRTSQSGMYGWWDSFTTIQSADYNVEMVYDCDGGLGAPTAIDCSNLVYSGLAPRTSTVQVSPGPGTQFVSFRTCNVGITALTTITVTWSQIQAALTTLIDNCVMHPLLPPRGGKAYAVATHSRPGGRRTRKRIVNGLNALPTGLNLTMFYQTFPASENPDAELRSCTWQQAIGTRGPANICPPGT